MLRPHRCTQCGTCTVEEAFCRDTGVDLWQCPTCDYTYPRDRIRSEHTRLAHIDTVRVGDVVRCADGVDRTVCPQNLKRGGFMGTTLWGDSYKCGTTAVEIVDIPTPIKNHAQT